MFEQTNRRVFYQRIIQGMLGIVTLMVSLPAIVYLFFSGKIEQKSNKNWTDVGEISTLKLNEPKELVFQRLHVDGWKNSMVRATAWIVKTEKEMIAFQPRCTHLGCGYHWSQKEKEFVCPCHASSFSVTGEVLKGPAPRSLDRFETRIEGKRLWLGENITSVRESRS